MKYPHLLLFNPDQWRGDVLGHRGNPAAITPALDHLVQTQAVSFGNTFCQNPVCTPSRCSFMTGWYPHVRGHRTMFHMLHQDEPCLLKILKDNGYFVWWAGKNDLIPAQNGFADYCTVKYQPRPKDFKRWGCASRPNLHGDQSWRGKAGSDNYYSFYAGRLSQDDDPYYADDDWAMILGTIDFLRTAPLDQPLCIFLPLSYPHPPYGVEDPWYSAIDRRKLPPRLPSIKDWSGKPSLLHGIAQRQNMTGWSEPRWDELRATYYGMCARVDHQLSLIIQAMKNRGIWDDTAAFVFSDHGDFTGDYGLVEKTQNTFEDCLTRVPLIIKPPHGVQVKPRMTEALVELVDLPATIYDMTGIVPAYTHFGRSLLPLLVGKTEEHRDAVFSEGGRLKDETHASEKQSMRELTPEGLYWPRVSLQTSDPVAHGKAIMCRTKNFKYVRRLCERDELYDLQHDPGELQNRIDDPALAGVKAELQSTLLDHYQRTCDVVPHQADRRY